MIRRVEVGSMSNLLFNFFIMFSNNELPIECLNPATMSSWHCSPWQLMCSVILYTTWHNVVSIWFYLAKKCRWHPRFMDMSAAFCPFLGFFCPVILSVDITLKSGVIFLPLRLFSNVVFALFRFFCYYAWKNLSGLWCKYTSCLHVQSYKWT